MGGIVHYRGFVVSLHSERLVANLSSYVASGRGRLDLSDGSHLNFLQRCSTRVTTGDICRFSELDSLALGCGSDSPSISTSINRLERVVESSSEWRIVSIVLLVSLGTSVVFLVLCRRYRHTKSMPSDLLPSHCPGHAIGHATGHATGHTTGHATGPTTGHATPTLTNSNAADGDDKMSVGHASSTKSSRYV